MMSRESNKIVFWTLIVFELLDIPGLHSSPTLAAEVAREMYQSAPESIRRVLDAPATPVLSVSPTRGHILLIDLERYPPISEVAKPMLRLAGLRISPQTNSPHNETRYRGISIQRLDGGQITRLPVPDNPHLSIPRWSQNGRFFAFTLTTKEGVQLWVADAQQLSCRRFGDWHLNTTYADAIGWMPDGETIVCLTVPLDRAGPPAAPEAPSGPVIQETAGAAGPARTFQDLLKNAHDEELFDFYVTSQAVLVNVRTGQERRLGGPRIFRELEPSPDGGHFLVASIHRPYSYLLPVSAFPRHVEVWDLNGNVEFSLAQLPLQDRVPIEGVPTGPRSYHWRPTEPATLVWVEALDEGDPRNKVPARDRLLMLRHPFRDDRSNVMTIEQRFSGLTWSEYNGQLMVRDYDRDRRWSRTFLLSADRLNDGATLIWDRSINDRYNDPGTPLMRTLANGQRVMWQSGDDIFLEGTGATPAGDRPFLDRFNLATRQSQRLFQCDDHSYETAVALLEPDGSRFITRHETNFNVPNFYVRSAVSTERKPITQFADPTPELRKIQKRLVTYKRNDGVSLSFTLYLPPDYVEGQRLPTILWAYPREYSDQGTAGQVTGSTNRFTSIQGISHLFLLLSGYAVLDGATVPVVGDPEKMNDTYVEQIVASAQAAIDTAVELGVTDRNRVGIGGHSYGAFMTANLLAHCSLFRAGVARSGAYNRTLTPFGFQSERRTLWEAPETYIRLSPFMVAHKISAPLLLIHGADDDNPGTFPMQSERLYQAIRGNNGTARLVILPHESHGYSARESVEHTLFEMVSWFDKNLK